jgi:hypothetical protein
MCQSCQTWPATFGQILLRTDTRLVFCNRKLMRTDIFFTRTTKPICNFANSIVLMFNININYTTARMDYAISARPSRTPIVIRGKSRWTQKSDRGNWFVVSSYKPRCSWWTAEKKKNITCSYILIFVSVCYLNASLSRTCWVLNGVYFIVNFIFVFICNT